MAEKWVIETVKFWIQFKTEEDIKIYKKNSTNIKTCKKSNKSKIQKLDKICHLEACKWRKTF